ncbi:MAG: AraC family transcriptional regulator [Candidatus Pseudobacter hemicellulosilyticus]|uniref:AraC family transcriptional regulator n=1 Tax=Candidatus Pseudobacter hemicellulosilyticus TaxID=3121375 RepID=A0AAJ6BJL2_9BACT|nr:MAG: AraC family transcriptional regulator [Pseudobacter sp.]
MLNKILREIIPLTSNDCFTIFSREKAEFDFPLHSHEEMELNFICNAPGARRIVGDHISTIGDYELVLVGPNLPHVWETYRCKTKKIKEITVQFHKDLLEEKFLRRNQLSFIKRMLELSARGISFSPDTAKAIQPSMEALTRKQGFDSVLELLSLLHTLSISRDSMTLSDTVFGQAQFSYNSRRISMVVDYINQHFHRNITLSEVAKMANMTDVSFSRFIKSRTGINFMDILLEARLGNAARMLIDSTQSISEIAYNCGFNNISNFNRLFKKKKGTTPKEFRKNYNYYGTRKFI